MKKANSFTHGLAALALCAVAALPAACAASSSGSASDPQGFTLTDGFLAKYQAVETDSIKDPCQLSPVKVLGLTGEGAGKATIDQMAARYDAQPGVHAMLASHGVTAKEMILGTVTLMSAAIQELKQQHPGMVQGNGAALQISAANMAFYQSHKQAIRQFNMQIAQQQLRANGGKLPPCLSESAG
ncbi:MAG: hypothetical protein BGP10_08365 [Rhodanobacter sp. 68-29]|nr:hypothetical protein [Rhodanobacter sp.]ODU75732.1 MAG: hypothetical protein ABT17_03200 [Rhodanobacter sp. SCN 69-32]OJY57019.1 MAG: hypothetical protein BGP10_08365 [Rhodanobacter sp. 68-29]